MEKVHILLPVHNRVTLTEIFVKNLIAQKNCDYHLVLIDDGSSDGTAEMVTEYIPSATILRGEGDWWWAGSLQKGIDFLKTNIVNDSDIILFINDDVTFAEDYLASAISVMQNRTGLLLLSKFSCDGGKIIEETGIFADLKKLTFCPALAPTEVNCLSTRGLFVRLCDIKIVGDFYPRILPHYLSDYEYTIRAARKGMKLETTDSVYICPNHDSTGYHQFKEQGFVEFIQKYFSIKSAVNPVYWSVFVILTVPKMWWIPNIVKIWLQTFKIIFIRLFYRQSVSKK